LEDRERTYIESMTVAESRMGDRLKAAICVGAFHVLIGYVLLAGFAVKISRQSDDKLKIFDVSADVLPAPEPAPLKNENRKASGAAAPKNLKSVATETAAPVPVILLPIVPPFIVAPKPSSGLDHSSGASTVPGPGTGSGGQGVGSGSGRYGDGDGDGDETPPRRISGRIKDSDYPAAAGDAGVGGTVSVRYRVGIDGRASACSITRSSGSDALDAATCRIIEQRFRYAPSRDAGGNPVSSIIEENHSWIIERQPSQP